MLTISGRDRLSASSVERDFINNEIGIFYNGYESQTGKPIITGTPTKWLEEMFELALEAYKRIEPTLRPGKSSADSLDAAKFVLDSGYDYLWRVSPRHARCQPAPRAADRFRSGAEQ